MSINLHVLKASGRLDKFEPLIKEAFEGTLAKINESITLPSVDVVITDDAESAIPETGVGGSAPSAHLLYIHINPEFKNLVQTLNYEIRSTLAHELHHCARFASVGYGHTLQEAIISEGLADHFDIEINGGEPKPWSVAIQEQELEPLLQQAKLEFNNPEYDHSAWFYGSSTIPRWAGYSLGLKIVRDYMTKTGRLASELVDVDSKDFF